MKKGFIENIEERTAANSDVANHDLCGEVPGRRTGDIRRNFNLVHGVSNIRFR